MALKGSIKEFALPEIFQLIFHQKKEGILALTKGSKVVSIVFKEGRILRAYEGEGDEKFGQNLIKAGILTDDQLVISRYRKENIKKSLEGCLIDLEFISADELKRLTRLFTEETIFKIFDWQSGDYEFEQQEISYSPLLIQPLDVQFILMEAVRQIDEWPFLIKKITSRASIFEKVEPLPEKAPENTPSGQSTTKGEDFFGEIGDDDVENKTEDWVFSQIDGEKTVQGMIDQAQFSAFSTYQALCELVNEKRIQEKKDEALIDEVEISTRFSKESVLKYLAGGVVSIFSIALIILSYSSIEMTSLRALRSFQVVRSLSEKNERYFIRFALDLYYLKYNRYPDKLRFLAEEGFFGHEKEIVNHLSNWKYHLEAGNSAQFHLEQK